MALNNDSKQVSPQIKETSDSKPQGLTLSKDTEQNKVLNKKNHKKNHKELSQDAINALYIVSDKISKDLSNFKKTSYKHDNILINENKELNTNVEELISYMAKESKAEKPSKNDFLPKTGKGTDPIAEEKHDDEERIARIEEVFEKTNSVLEKNDESLRGALLGPLNLLVKPFESFFDFNLTKMIRTKLFGGEKSKRNPTESDVTRIGIAGAGYLYIAHKMEDLFGEGDKLGLESLFGESDIISNAKKLLSGKNLSVAGLIAGLGWTVMDAVHGYLLADEWGVDNVTAAITGAIAGTGEGFPNAIKNGAKWALTAGSAGFAVGGPIGALVGALGGLVFGAVGGYIGGEEVSRDIQNAKDIIFTEKTGKDVQKENLLRDIDEKAEKGEISSEYASAMHTLSESMSTEDFASLGKGVFETNKHNLAEWLISYGKGDLDVLTGGEKSAIDEAIFGVDFNTPHRNEILKFYKWLGSTFGHDTGFLAKALKNRDNLYGLLTSLPEASLKDASFRASYTAPDSEKYVPSVGASFLKQYLESQPTKPSAEGFNREDILKSFNKRKVNDAIIQTNGQVIETNPKDTLVALKDIPTSIAPLLESQKDLKKSMLNEGNTNMGGTITKKLDILIKLLQNILTKEPVKLALPSVTRQDLDLIMTGGIV